MESPEEIEETEEKPPEVDLKVLEAIKAKELAEDRFSWGFLGLFYHCYVAFCMPHIN